MSIKTVTCCCASGLGSSLLMRMNVERVLTSLGYDSIKVSHASIIDAASAGSDLYVVSGDLEKQTKSLPNVILLNNIMSMPEIEDKLKKALGE